MRDSYPPGVDAGTCPTCGGRVDSYGDPLSRPAAVPVEALRELDERFDFTNPEATRRRLRELIDQAERRGEI